MKGGRLIKYNAFKPETLEFWVPPAFYRDGKIELELEKIRGDYACSGPIYVYRYEYEEEEEMESLSGIQGISMKGEPGLILPTFIKDNRIKLLNIPYEKAEIQIFDIAGRKIYSGFLGEKVEIPFEKGSGAYILIIRNPETGKKIYRKFIKLK